MSDIDNLIKTLSKEFEDKIAQPLADLAPIDAIPFGIKTLDEITGIGGIPRGRVTELFGSESSGKSSLCLAAVAEAQKMGLKCAYIDMELSMTKELASKMGVNLDTLLYAQPVTGEEALQLIDSLLEKDVKMIVMDSVSSMVPEDELEAEFDEQSMALQARLMSKGMRKLLGSVKRNNAALVFINQMRDDIGKMGFGPKTTTSGGKALRFYSSLRMKVARKAWIDDNKGEEKRKAGLVVTVHVEKNKMSQPKLETEFNFYFDKGFDKGSDLLSYALSHDEVRVLGRTYFVGEKEIGSKEEIIKYLIDKENKNAPKDTVS